MRLTFRGRMTAWYAATLSALLLVFAVQVYALVRAGLLGELDGALRADLEYVEWMLGTTPERLEAGPEIPALPLLTISLREGHRRDTEAWREAGLDGALAGLPFDTPILWSNEAGDTFRVLKAAPAGDVRVGLARPADDARVALHALALTLGIGLPSTLAFALLGGLLLARRALRPVGAMAARARAITAERLDARLPVENPHDEFGELATVFNETLERLERSFEQLRCFTADASHQLRTPLAAMRAVGEAGLREGASPEALREAIASMLEEADRLASLTADLLTITRAEAGQLPLRRERLDIGTLVQESVDTLRPLAEEAGLALACDVGVPAAAVEADAALLRQAVLNVLDNAVRYTPPGGSVGVRVACRDGAVVVEVRDSGPGIAGEVRGREFERFVRGRTDLPGTGLGLAVTRWATEANGGRVEVVETGPGGTLVRFQFPAAEA
jgi:signal transduction histidine kinase